MRGENIQLKPLSEKWVTAFNKDNHCFVPIIETINDSSIIDNSDFIDYNNLSITYYFINLL